MLSLGHCFFLLLLLLLLLLLESEPGLVPGFEFDEVLVGVIVVAPEGPLETVTVLVAAAPRARIPISGWMMLFLSSQQFVSSDEQQNLPLLHCKTFQKWTGLPPFQSFVAATS